MHKATVNNRFFFKHNLVTVAALQAFLILIASVIAILHLLEIPYNAKFPNSGYKVALLLPVLGHLC